MTTVKWKMINGNCALARRRSALIVKLPRLHHTSLRRKLTVCVTRSMRVLGIDPGSETTGWGVIESDGRRYRLVECGAIKASQGQKFSARLLKISIGIEEVIARHSPSACAIEDGFLATNVKVTLKLGQVRGVAMLAAERAALDIH